MLDTTEPTPSGWVAADLTTVLTGLVLPTDRVAVLAVDGRGASGKTTLARRIVDAHQHAALVHTDDIAWHYSMFDWSDALIEGVLQPVRAGEPVRYRPPGWPRMGREGFVEVPAGVPMLVIEGSGVGRRDLSQWFDALIWVHADADRARERGLARDLAEGVNGGTRADAERFWDEWMLEELPFFEREQTWARADVSVCGDPQPPLPPGQVAVAEF